VKTDYALIEDAIRLAGASETLIDEVLDLLENIGQEITQLRTELESIGDITGIAGVDEPMTIAECVIALKAERDAWKKEAEALAEGKDTTLLADRVFSELKTDRDALVR
jgi:hypothetical protein